MKIDQQQIYIAEIRKRLATNPRQVVAVLGAGVSIASAPKHKDVLSWVGLLKNGSRRCPFSKKALIDALWVAYDKCPEAGRTSLLITIAQALVGAFGSQDSKEFDSWIKEVFSNIKPNKDNEDLVQALVDTGAILLTTNYDTLVERIADCLSLDVDDSDRATVERVISGDAPGVIHLHGVWTNPSKIILDWDSYLRAKKDRFLQLLMDSSGLGRHLIFVGYGSGTDDPNFSAWIERMAGTFPNTLYEKFMLVTEGHTDIPKGIIPLVYAGQGQYDKLPDFIRSLTPAQSAAVQMRRLPRVSACFGRDTELSEMVSALTKNNSCRILVYGPAGIGKSMTGKKSLHHPAVKQYFGERLFYFDCDKARGYADLVYKLGFVVDAIPSPHLSETRETLIADLQESAVLFLDNFETLSESEDSEKVEAFLKQLACVANLKLLVASRGNSIPFSGIDWTHKYKLLPIVVPYDENIFLRTAGEQFVGDPILRKLLNEMEGVPLAIKLVAHLAATETCLENLFERWKEHKTDLLQNGSGTNRDESWALSLGLTLASPRMQSPERALLSCLAFFPDGMSQKFLEDKLPLAHSAINTLIELGLVEEMESGWLWMLAPIREYVHRLYPSDSQEIVILTDAVISYANQFCSLIGGENGLIAVQKIRPIVANIEASIRFGLKGLNWMVAAKAAQSYAAAVTLSCIGDQTVLDEAYETAKTEGFNYPNPENNLLIAKLRRTQAKVAEESGNFQKAEAIYLDIAKNLVSTLSGVERERLEARIQKDLADVALAKREVKATTLYARARFLLSRKGIGFEWHPIACVLGEAAATLIYGELLGDTKAVRIKTIRETKRKVESILKTLPTGDVPQMRRIKGKCHQLLSKMDLDLKNEHDALRHLIKALVEFGPTGDIKSCSDCISNLIIIATESADVERFFKEYISNGELVSHSGFAWKAQFLTFGHIHLRLGSAMENYDDQESVSAAKFHYLAAREFGKKASDAHLIKQAEAGISV